MVLNIRNARADALARELAELKGVSITEAVLTALDDAVRARRKRQSSREIIDAILKEKGIKRRGAGEPVAQEVWDDVHDNASRHV